MPHTDNLVGLDDYDRMLAADMEYQRPLYGPRETPIQTADSGVTIEPSGSQKQAARSDS